jgi:hypothetical protein
MPLSTRQIMRAAYLEGLVPHHLHGRTQHKTLGARLSEDILTLKHRSRFFRTRPGRFFVRSLMKDRSLPIEYRTSIVARRRRRDLKRTNIACIREGLLGEMQSTFRTDHISPSRFTEIIESGLVQYSHLNTLRDDGLVPIFSYVVVRRRGTILVHTRSAYAESRSSFANRIMVGFPIPVCHDDMTLFDIDDHGVVSAGLTAVAIDLDLEFSAEFPQFEQEAFLTKLLPVAERNGAKSLLGLVEVEAPEEFEPGGRRLSIGGLEWADSQLTGYHFGEFDPWSRQLLREVRARPVLGAE